MDGWMEATTSETHGTAANVDGCCACASIVPQEIARDEGSSLVLYLKDYDTTCALASIGG